MSTFRTLDVLPMLSELEPVVYAVGKSGAHSSEACRFSEVGKFTIFADIGDATTVDPPFNWRQDPFESRSWQAQLHTLRFLDVLFFRYGQSEDLRALRMASEIAVDWCKSNLHGAEEISEFAWGDKVTGDRAPYLGYVLREAARHDLLSPEDASVLWSSVLDHIEFLLDETTYTARSNHGLAQDIGLVLLSGYLDFLPESACWRRFGLQRFVRTLSAHLSTDEGLYLEHSPHYQWVIGNLVRRFIRMANLADKRLENLLDELEGAAGWLVLPDGRTPPIGDSDLEDAPAWARTAAAECLGLKLFPHAGVAVSRHRESMLITTASYHSRVHKHADELGFCLVEKGKLLLAEAGKFSYDSHEPARQYALSASGHNVLLVDGRDFTPADQAPYGGGIVRGGAGQGVQVIEGINPLLKSQGVSHARTFVYAPGRITLVIDRLESTVVHSYQRLFHFTPQADIDQSSAREVQFSMKNGPSGTLIDYGQSDGEMDVGVGDPGPPMRGWMFPSFREWQPAATISLTTRGSSALLAAAIWIGRPVDLRISEKARHELSIEGGARGSTTELVVRRVGATDVEIAGELPAMA